MPQPAAQCPRRRRVPRAARGVTLVEALLCFLVLSLGLLAMARVHAQMRADADLARQRTGALQIAQTQLETWRCYVVLGDSAVHPSYADITTAAASLDIVEQGTRYRVERRVASLAGGLASSVTITVHWQDRGGADQHATLASIIAASEPALEAANVTAPAVDPLQALHPAVARQ